MTRPLINALSFAALCWIVLVMYQSITGGRIWSAVYSVVEHRAATFAVLALAVIIPLAGFGWLIARLLLRAKRS